MYTSSNRGFTLVELLIVIVVIAILAAISVVAYNGVQNRSQESAAMADLRKLGQKIQLVRVDNNEKYPSSTLGWPTLVVPVTKSAFATTGVTYNIAYCVSADQQNFAIAAVTKSGKKIRYHMGNVSEYSGTNDGISSASNDCSSVLPGTLRGAAGYNPTDTTTGPWRAWVGGN